MVLDLVAQVPGEDVEELAALQVRRAEDLAEVPLAAGLVLRLLLGELLRALGEVAAEDDREGPQVADQVGGRVSGQREHEAGPGEGREQHVVLQGLAADLAPDALQHRALLLQGRLAGGDPVELDVVHRDPVLEEGREHRRRTAGCRGSTAATAGPPTCAGCRIRCRGPCRRCWCGCGACSCGSGATGRRGRPCPTRTPWPRASGRWSSRTGRASRCARSPCCRGSSRAREPRCPASQAGGMKPTKSSPRPPTSRPLCTLITRRM